MDGLVGLIVFAVFAILWIAFGAAIVRSQGSLDEAWQWLRSLPLVFQGVVALLLLPVVIGLWVWERSWPLVARLVLVAGLAVWTAYMFFPRSAGRPSAVQPRHTGSSTLHGRWPALPALYRYLQGGTAEHAAIRDEVVRAETELELRQAIRAHRPLTTLITDRAGAR